MLISYWVNIGIGQCSKLRYRYCIGSETSSRLSAASKERPISLGTLNAT